jgi:DNA-binding MarR family transcriptional regulator
VSRPRETDDLSEVGACACFAVRRAARGLTRCYDRHLRPSRLRVNQFTLLVVLKNGGSQSIQVLADTLGVERTTLTRNVQPLVARRLVTAEAGEDRRVRRLSVTPAGVQAAVTALPLWRKAQRQVEKQIAPATLKALRALSL